MSRPAQLTRTYLLDGPRPLRAEIHVMDCPCRRCDPDAPLTAGDIGKHGLAGFGLGIVIAVALDPAHVARALLAIFGVGL